MCGSDEVAQILKDLVVAAKICFNHEMALPHRAPFLAKPTAYGIILVLEK